MKPGYKTSEFWLSLAAVLVSAFLAAGVLPVDHWAVKAAGLIAAALAAAGYGSSRAQLKASQPADPLRPPQG